MGKVIDGRGIAQVQAEVLKSRVSRYKEYMDYNPSLIIFQYGTNSASEKYIQKKCEKGKEVGIYVGVMRYSEDTPFEHVLYSVQEADQSNISHGIIIQHPIPAMYLSREQELFDAISPEKDVDGLSAASQGRLFTGQSGFMACTAKGIMRLLDLHTSILGKHVTIVGASNIVGKPLAVSLVDAGATVAVTHRSSQEKDILHSCQHSDIIISACGVPGRIRENYVRPGAILIDAGYKDGVGDIHADCYEKSSWYTPVPGGVGPMTVITLLEHTFEAAQ